MIVIQLWTGSPGGLLEWRRFLVCENFRISQQHSSSTLFSFLPTFSLPLRTLFAPPVLKHLLFRQFYLEASWSCYLCWGSLLTGALLPSCSREWNRLVGATNKLSSHLVRINLSSTQPLSDALHINTYCCIDITFVLKHYLKHMIVIQLWTGSPGGLLEWWHNWHCLHLTVFWRQAFSRLLYAQTFCKISKPFNELWKFSLHFGLPAVCQLRYEVNADEPCGLVQTLAIIRLWLVAAALPS
jgi:hypothetical protein